MVEDSAVEQQGYAGSRGLVAGGIEARRMEVDIHGLPVERRTRAADAGFGLGGCAVVEAGAGIAVEAAKHLVDVGFVSVLNVNAAVGGAAEVAELDVDLRVAEPLVADQRAGARDYFHRPAGYEVPSGGAIFGEPILLLHPGPGIHVRAVEQDAGAGRGFRAQRRRRAGGLLHVEGLAVPGSLEVAAGDSPGPAVAGKGDVVAGEFAVQYRNRLVVGLVELAEDVGLVMAVVGLLRNLVLYGEDAILDGNHLGDVAGALPIAAILIRRGPIEGVGQFDFLGRTLVALLAASLGGLLLVGGAEQERAADGKETEHCPGCLHAYAVL